MRARCPRTLPPSRRSNPEANNLKRAPIVFLAAALLAVFAGCMGVPQKDDSVKPVPSGGSSDGRRVYRSVPAAAAGDKIALTFDDGPHPVLTPKLLDTLKEKHVRATFFLVGKRVAEHPELVRRIIAEGHEIGNHSWSHADLTRLSRSQVASEIDRTQQAIEKAGAPAPHLMRPPYGAINASVVRQINGDFGMDIVLWTVDPQDWKTPGQEAVKARILADTKPGYIVLSHDIQPDTVAVMGSVIDGLKSRGFEFVTVSQLLRYAPAPAAASAPKPAN